MFTRLAVGFASLIGAAVPALAQQTNIDDRFRRQTQEMTERERATALMTGDTDLILMRRTPLLTATGSFGASVTSNAFLSPDNVRSDAVFQAQAGLRIGTRIAGRFDVYAEAGVLGVRYARFASLDYGAFTGAVGAATRLGGFDLALDYRPSIVTTRDYGKRQLTQHQFSTSLARPVQLGRVTLTPSVSGQRVEASPSDYRNWSMSADLSVTYPFAIRGVPAALFAAGGVERRLYDGYFTDLLGVKRKDWLTQASVGIVVQPTRWARVRAAYSFQRNRTTSDVNGYTAHSGAFTVGVAARF